MHAAVREKPHRRQNVCGQKEKLKMKNSFIRALSLGIALAFPMTVLAQEAGGEKPAAEKKEGKKGSKKEKKAEGAAGDTGAAAGGDAGKAEGKKGKKSKADKAAGEGAAKP
jgi:hypothetical protein